MESITGNLGESLGDSLPIPDVTGPVVPKLPTTNF